LLLPGVRADQHQIKGISDCLFFVAIRLALAECTLKLENVSQEAAPTKALQIHYTNNDGGVCANTQAQY
jgi:hypothetical protein